MPELVEITAGYPPSLPANAFEVTQIPQDDMQSKVFIVLDDDPTGTQSVQDVPVLTCWQEDDFRWAFAQGASAIYVLTNSRSLSGKDALSISKDVVATALKVAKELEIEVVFVSRSDSTLRGHFPLETDAIAEMLQKQGQNTDAFILLPAFPEAGRVTIGGTHYTRLGNRYVPVSETEFAADATFGYTSSELRKWVEEKSAGAVKARDVTLVDLGMLRTDPRKVRETLEETSDRNTVVVDCADEADLLTVAAALRRAENNGKKFIYRVGPPFVRAIINQGKAKPLTASEILKRIGRKKRNVHTLGGLVVVGSHTDLTTAQLGELRSKCPSKTIEVQVSLLLESSGYGGYIESLAQRITSGLEEGLVIVHTSRDLVLGDDGDSSLEVSRCVSQAVVDLVEKVLSRASPSFVLAKGGITSSDVATKAMKISRANVLGCLLPGMVALWAASDGPSVGIPYVIFPGNVGDKSSLAKVYSTLSQL